MAFRNQFWWKSLLIPGGLVFVTGVAILSGGILRSAPVLLASYYYVVFLCGLLLAWRFHSSRIFSALILLLLAHQTIEFFAAGRSTALGPGRSALESVAFFVAIDFIWIGFSSETGFKLSAFADKLIALFLQSVFVAVICRPRPAPGSDLFHNAIVPATWLNWTHIAQVPLIAVTSAFVVLVFRHANTVKPVDSGLAWAVASAGVAFSAGGAGLIAQGYFATSALILIVSVVEASYRMAYHDELTGLASRRAWNDQTAHLDSPYTVAVVDIDHFKQFNDVYGHDTGDEVLRMVAGRLAKVAGGGQAFRIGGEEFTILFRGIGVTHAIPHLETVHAGIAEARFRLRGADRRATSRGPERRQSLRNTPPSRRKGADFSPDASELSVTVSMGVSEGKNNDAISESLARADKALYQAKANGRNRIEVDGKPSVTSRKPPRIRAKAGSA
jgi:diguanylate cyclase (GGDEF)-like protein